MGWYVKSPARINNDTLEKQQLTNQTNGQKSCGESQTMDTARIYSRFSAPVMWQNSLTV